MRSKSSPKHQTCELLCFRDYKCHVVARRVHILRMYHAPPPPFGDAHSPWAAVSGTAAGPLNTHALIDFSVAFYVFWKGFSSKRPMAAAEKWDIRDAPNRDTR
jgi:hypothetical protein